MFKFLSYLIITVVFTPLFVSAQMVYSSGARSEWKPFPGNPVVVTSELKLGYFDGDRKVDLLRAVRLSRGPNRYEYQYFSSKSHSWQSITEGNVPLNSIKVADFTGDGISDFLTNFQGYWNLCDGSVTGCSWTPGRYSMVSWIDLYPGDFDGDGAIELFHKNNGNFQYSKWNPNSQWQALSKGNPNLILHEVDVDGDGKTDLLTKEGTVRKYRSAGLGNWITLEVTSNDKIDNSIFGDYDGDGKADMLYAERSQIPGKRVFAAGCGSNSVDFVTTNFGVWNLLRSRTGLFADVDGDGKTDLIMNKSHTTSLIWQLAGAIDGWQPDPDVSVYNVTPQSLSQEKLDQTEPYMAMNPSKTHQIFTTTMTPISSVYVGDVKFGWKEVGFNTTPAQRPLADAVVVSDETRGVFGLNLKIGNRQSDLKAWHLSKLDAKMQIKDANVSWPSGLNSGQFDQPKILYIDYQSGNTKTPYMLITGNNIGLATVARADYTVNPQGIPMLTNILYDIVDDRTDKYTTIKNYNAFRTAVTEDQVIYGAYMRPVDSGNPVCEVTTPKPPAPRPLVLTTEVVVVRDDNISDNQLFKSLKGTGGLNGQVAFTVPAPSVYYPALGYPNDDLLGPRARLGNDISIAVDPKNSNQVFIAWPELPNFDPNQDCPTNETAVVRQQIAVARSLDSGRTWNRITTIPNATNPKLAVNEQGSVALLCQKYHDGNSLMTGTPWETLVRIWSFAINEHQDFVLNRWSNPDYFGDDDDSAFLLGDYVDMETNGDKFVGVFPGYNLPHFSNFPYGVKYFRDVNFYKNRLTYLNSRGNPFGTSPSNDLMYFEIKDPNWQGPKPQENTEKSYGASKGGKKQKGGSD